MAKNNLRPFVGVDGEGCGKDRKGRQHYMLFRIGDQEFYTGKPLQLVELLNFICESPPEPMMIGFSFGYDATQILRQLPPDRLMNGGVDPATGEVKRGSGIFDEPLIPGNPWITFFEDFGIEYIPNRKLWVCRLEPFVRPDGRVSRRVMKESGRTIWDCYRFFRRTFLDSLKVFDVGREHWPALAAMKAKRRDFSAITPEIRDYCALECRLLAELMERFRELTHSAGLRPNSWSGAGQLASYLHRKNATPLAPLVQFHIPKACRQMAMKALFGGRFEITRIGRVDEPVYEYDQNSAYPSAMRNLPCVWHGKWHEADGAQLVDATLQGRLFLAAVEFDHPSDLAVCGLPIRNKEGSVYWPRRGKGVYWSCELRAARRLGATIRLSHGWIYENRCECHTFNWIEALYVERKLAGISGEPIKLALNALNGKFLERRYGLGTYYNPLWAGLVTARTRAAMVDAARHDPASVVMFATDALYSTKPLPLPISEELGDWKQELHPSLFIVRPGLYWSPEKLRTAGLSSSVFAPYAAKFEKEWRYYRHLMGDLIEQTHLMVSVPIEVFTSLRYAVIGLHDASEAGKWFVENGGKGRAISFGWWNKRANPYWQGEMVLTTPRDGAPDVESADFDPSRADELDRDRLIYEDQPDHLDLSHP